MPQRSDLPIAGDPVRTLAALLDETGSTEIESSVGDRRIRVARTAAAPTPTVNVAATSALPAAEASAAPAAVAPVDHPGAIKAPMVGTAYIAPQPDHPPFVKLGDRVDEG